MRLASKRRMFWIQAAILWLLLGLAITVFIRSEIKPLDADELKITASDLGTFSRTTEQLLTQYSHGDLTDAFFHTQLSLIKDKVTSERKSLESAKADDEVELDQRKTIEAAKRLEDMMAAVDANSQNYDSAENELETLHQTFKSIEDQMTLKAEAK